MKIPVSAAAAVSLLVLCACSDAAHVGLVPTADAANAASAPLGDPPYGTPYGMGDAFAPFQVPGL